jgi:hypothetical protein
MSFVAPERTFACQPGQLSAVLAEVDRDRGRLEVQVERSPDVFAALVAPTRGALLGIPGDAPVTAAEIVQLHEALTDERSDRSPIRDEHADAASGWRPWETPGFLLDALVAHHNRVVLAGLGHPVVLTAAFLLDFLTLCPLVGDNRRTARALAVRILAWHGHSVVRYADVEEAVFGGAADDALAASQEGWAEGRHTIWPWTTHVVDGLAEVYEGVERRVAAGAGLRGHSKQERVRRYVLDYATDTFRISQIREALPEVSDGTIRLALETLKRDQRIELRTPGRDATWHRRDRDAG